ncbi:MAG: hypothetical protein H6621_06620 [Halobacteriovoraceae bacterium]|nr:hypothetical protein [Halobacteriovoraceae bacterium]
MKSLLVVVFAFSLNAFSLEVTEDLKDLRSEKLAKIVEYVEGGHQKILYMPNCDRSAYLCVKHTFSYFNSFYGTEDASWIYVDIKELNSDEKTYGHLIAAVEEMELSGEIIDIVKNSEELSSYVSQASVYNEAEMATFTEPSYPNGFFVLDNDTAELIFVGYSY